jgi:uncharacterized protein RhaS with RHS repeats
VAVAVDEFDAVVLERVVRGGNDDAEARTELRAEHGDGRSGQLADENDIHSGGIDPCGERRLEHFARSTRVAAHDAASDAPRPPFAAEHDGGRLREAHDELWGHGVTIGHGTNAVGAEELALFRHRRRVLTQNVRGVKARWRTDPHTLSTPGAVSGGGAASARARTALPAAPA